MKILTIFIFSVVIIFSVFVLIAFIGNIGSLQNPDSFAYRVAKEAIQKPGANIKSIEDFTKLSIRVSFYAMIYLIGSAGILFFKKWARYLIIIAPLIVFISDAIITPVIVVGYSPIAAISDIVFYAILALLSLFLFFPKVKAQFSNLSPETCSGKVETK